MVTILGINAYHGDSSACLVVDGRLIAAAEEERFRRIKHWAGFPSEAIRYCLAEGGLRLDQVDHVASNKDIRANFWRKLAFSLTGGGFKLAFNRLLETSKRTSLSEALTEAFPGSKFKGEVHAVEHHLAHMSSTFHVSPFEEAAVVSVDGFGDFASAAWGFGQGNRISIDSKVYYPHSLGIFYMAMTQYLGFPHWGDEYKVMGLAPYGEPNLVQKISRLVALESGGGYSLDLKYFRHMHEDLQEWPGSAPHVKTIFTKELEELLGPARQTDEPLTQRHKDIARSTQAVYEEAFFHLLNALHSKHGGDNLALAGGCALNSVANGKIYRRTPYKKLFLQAASGDAGGAIGSAYAVWHKLGGQRGFIMDHANWGPGYGDQEIRNLLASHAEAVAAQGCTVEWIQNDQALCDRTAACVADGKVIGWFQGRMEWGPRALGNRSIVCDPRRADMKDILNLKIKRRESFRPFAPSIIREAVPDWFEQDDDVPFMMQVYPIREEKRPLIPAVTHVDGSGRLQTVSREANPLYHRLIKSFESLTGVPLVLNTSFNENEPVVCRPEEALDCFLRTKMDVLVMGNCFIYRAGGDNRA